MSAVIYRKFPEIRHRIRYPGNESGERLLDYLGNFTLDNSKPKELEQYLKQDFKRFVYTLNVLPKARPNQSLLEIGANPYFTSILLRKYTEYDLVFTNFFGAASGEGKQIRRNEVTNEVFEFDYLNHNIEEDDLPFVDTFDAILFCEVLEHLTSDPMGAILRIKKALKRNATLVLTTPNVNRLENIARMLSGANIYDPYSGHGVYGRHNREYNKHEVFMLLSHCGFEIEEMFSADVHENSSDSYFPVKQLSKYIDRIKHRRLDLGQYIFVRARNVLPAKRCKPRWLFRSYPEEELCD